jgi:nitrile hydratase subunit beta
VNGIHDMGGMHGLPPIEYDPHEPPFVRAWYGRVFALSRALGPWGRGRRWRNFRYELELQPAADYLRMSYYERWFTVFVNRLLTSKLITQAELDSGRADPSAPRPQLLADTPGQGAGGSARLDTNVRARFRRGQGVRARNINPVGHTRLPRYARGKSGTIVKEHGVWNLQDTEANGDRIGGPQHVYGVRFTARELWGEQASSRDSVYIDLWEDYLERA